MPIDTTRSPFHSGAVDIAFDSTVAPITPTITACQITEFEEQQLLHYMLPLLEGSDDISLEKLYRHRMKSLSLSSKQGMSSSGLIIPSRYLKRDNTTGKPQSLAIYTVLHSRIGEGRKPASDGENHWLESVCYVEDKLPLSPRIGGGSNSNHNINNMPIDETDDLFDSLHLSQEEEERLLIQGINIRGLPIHKRASGSLAGGSTSSGLMMVPPSTGIRNSGSSAPVNRLSSGNVKNTNNSTEKVIQTKTNGIQMKIIWKSSVTLHDPSRHLQYQHDPSTANTMIEDNNLYHSNTTVISNTYPLTLLSTGMCVPSTHNVPRSPRSPHPPAPPQQAQPQQSQQHKFPHHFNTSTSQHQIPVGSTLSTSNMIIKERMLFNLHPSLSIDPIHSHQHRFLDRRPLLSSSTHGIRPITGSTNGLAVSGGTASMHNLDIMMQDMVDKSITNFDDEIVCFALASTSFATPPSANSTIPGGIVEGEESFSLFANPYGWLLIKHHRSGDLFTVKIKPVPRSPFSISNAVQIATQSIRDKGKNGNVHVPLIAKCISHDETIPGSTSDHFQASYGITALAAHAITTSSTTASVAESMTLRVAVAYTKYFDRRQTVIAIGSYYPHAQEQQHHQPASHMASPTSSPMPSKYGQNQEGQSKDQQYQLIVEDHYELSNWCHHLQFYSSNLVIYLAESEDGHSGLELGILEFYPNAKENEKVFASSTNAEGKNVSGTQSTHNGTTQIENGTQNDSTKNSNKKPNVSSVHIPLNGKHSGGTHQTISQSAILTVNTNRRIVAVAVGINVYLYEIVWDRSQQALMLEPCLVLTEDASVGLNGGSVVTAIAFSSNGALLYTARSRGDGNTARAQSSSNNNSDGTMIVVSDAYFGRTLRVIDQQMLSSLTSATSNASGTISGDSSAVAHAPPRSSKVQGLYLTKDDSMLVVVFTSGQISMIDYKDYSPLTSPSLAVDQQTWVFNSTLTYAGYMESIAIRNLSPVALMPLLASVASEAARSSLSTARHLVNNIMNQYQQQGEPNPTSWMALNSPSSDSAFERDQTGTSTLAVIDPTITATVTQPLAESIKILAMAYGGVGEGYNCQSIVSVILEDGTLMVYDLKDISHFYFKGRVSLPNGEKGRDVVSLTMNPQCTMIIITCRMSLCILQRHHLTGVYAFLTFPTATFIPPPNSSPTTLAAANGDVYSIQHDVVTSSGANNPTTPGQPCPSIQAIAITDDAQYIGLTILTSTSVPMLLVYSVSMTNLTTPRGTPSTVAAKATLSVAMSFWGYHSDASFTSLCMHHDPQEDGSNGLLTIVSGTISPVRGGNMGNSDLYVLKCNPQHHPTAHELNTSGISSSTGLLKYLQSPWQWQVYHVVHRSRHHLSICKLWITPTITQCHSSTTTLSSTRQQRDRQIIAVTKDSRVLQWYMDTLLSVHSDGDDGEGISREEVITASYAAMKGLVFLAYTPHGGSHNSQSGDHRMEREVIRLKVYDLMKRKVIGDEISVKLPAVGDWKTLSVPLKLDGQGKQHASYLIHAYN